MKAIRYSLAVCLVLVLLDGAAVSGLGQEQGGPEQHKASLDGNYQISPGDILDIKFFYSPELNELAVPVRPDGQITLQLIGDVHVAGLTPQVLRAQLIGSYNRYLKDPEIAVIIRVFNYQKVFVDGEVGRPGVVELNGPKTVFQAIAEAGGLKDTARTTEILVIRRGEGSKPVLLETNLEAILRKSPSGEELMLRPYDVIYVPRSKIANVNRWMDQYIRKNIPITFGFFPGTNL
jgi:protein involved in polysaccharide export with SLBB domain